MYKEDMLTEYGTEADDASTNPRNLGNLNDFLYNMEIAKIYKLCFDSLRPGGTLSIIIKDKTKDGKRVKLCDWASKSCLKMGFESYAWNKWKAPGTGFKNDWKSKGVSVVEDESIITVRKP
jgi:hypothetical protein